MATIKDLYAALNGDVAEVQAVADAQAAVDTATTTLTEAEAVLVEANSAVVDPENVTAEEQTAIDAAQAAVDTAITEKAAAEAALTEAQGNVDVGDSVAIAADLPVTDFGMVSNDMARAILAARGEEVKFEEPEDVKSDHNMRPSN